MALFQSPRRTIEKYLRVHPDVKTIVVAGAFGRTSALRALGQILGQQYIVTMGVNKNTETPDIILLDFASQTNFPNITPDITVILSATEDIQARAFFDLANRSHHVFINRNDVPAEYSQLLKNPNTFTYGDELPANFYFENLDADIHGQIGNFVLQNTKIVNTHVHLLGEHNLRPVIMAAAVASIFGVSPDRIKEGIESIRPLPGILSPSQGLNGSIIIDDSADTSALSIELALRTIYLLEAPSRILVTGPFDPQIAIDKELIDEVLVLDPRAKLQPDSIFRIFATEVELLAHLATRQEEGGIVLLELHLPALSTTPVN